MHFMQNSARFGWWQKTLHRKLGFNWCYNLAVNMSFDKRFQASDRNCKHDVPELGFAIPAVVLVWGRFDRAVGGLYVRCPGKKYT